MLHSFHFIMQPCSRQNFQSQFQQQQTCPVTDDSVKYRKKIEKELYGKLAATAKKYAAISATSVPSERLFSKARIILTERRKRLSGERLSMLIFLSSLGEEYWSFD
jgi:hypothetical protein